MTKVPGIGGRRMNGGDEIEYKPVSVKEVLGRMKDTAGLLVDLAYSSVLFGDEDLAREVLTLEEEMDILQFQARMSLVLAGRRPAEAEELASVFGIVGAAEKISDAAGDVAKVVLEDVNLPSALRSSLPDAVETLAQATVAAEGRYAGQTLGEVNMETETGVRVLAVRRGDEWILDPNRETTLMRDDVVFSRGPETGIEEVYQGLTGRSYVRPERVEPAVEDLDRAVETLVLMKNISELAVDLAYGSVLFDSESLAAEVQELEVEVDTLETRLEAWTLRAAGQISDPVSLRGLLHIASSTEMISDAALEISEGVLRGVGSHPVVAAAVADSDEVIVREEIEAGSQLAGQTIGAAEVRTRTGMHIKAIRRAEETVTDGRRYVLSPPPGTTLYAGDTVLATGTRAGAARLAAETATS